MKTFLKAPLLHFLIIGALLFVVLESCDDENVPPPAAITITADRINVLAENFRRAWKRSPTRTELDSLIEDRIREEMAVLEAEAMGFDQDDSYISSRLRMKLELLTGDLAAAAPPTDAVLQEYLSANREKYRVDAKISFKQVFLDADRDHDTLAGDAATLLEQLNAAGADASPGVYGDTTPLPPYYTLKPVSVIARDFGTGFAETIAELEPGTWQGPVESAYGMHLVMVDQIVAGYDPPLSGIRAAVEDGWREEHRREAIDDMYDRLKKKYTVIVEPPD